MSEHTFAENEPAPETQPAAATVDAAAVDTREEITPGTVIIWALLAVAFGIALWLRFYRLGEPIGGFHAFNEGFYSRIASIDASRGAFDWLFAPIDLNNPPLYSLLVAWLFKLLAPGEALARGVSAVAGVVAVGLTGLLGAELWNRRTGVLAALVLALMPGAVLVSRNVQTDSLMVALMLGALLTWMYSAREDGLKWAVASGLLLGLGVLTKLPAVLVVPAMLAWDVVQTRGLAWIRTRRTAATALCALVVTVPWYATRLALNPAAFVKGQSTTVGIAAGLFRGDMVRSLLVEPFWMLSVFAVVCVAAGAVVMARRREPGDVTVAVFFASVFAFLVFFHFHTYYLLCAAPVLALMAGRGLGAVKSARARSVVAVLTAVVLVGMALSSALMLSGNKWGQWSPVALQGLVAQSPGTTSVIVAAGLWDNSLGTAMQLYLPKDAAVRDGATVVPGAKQVIFIGPADGHDPAARQLAQTRVRPVVFGYALWQDPANVNFFQNGRWVAEKVGPIWNFGVKTDEFGARFAYTYLNAGAR